jgi:hypothetical protein
LNSANNGAVVAGGNIRQFFDRLQAKSAAPRCVGLYFQPVQRALFRFYICL